MKFRTELNTSFAGDLVNYRSQIITMGSCFADEIGVKLRDLEFSISVNPLGVIFNPISVLNILRHSLTDSINPDGFLQRENLFFHHDFHSSLYATSRDQLRADILGRQQNVGELLRSGNLLIITFGTAWAYRHLQSGSIVANCHKVPQTVFQKELLDLQTLKREYEHFFAQLFAANNSLRVILTVSPVRHIKDGLHENNLSKSILLLLSAYLQQTFKQVGYFPAYEIVMDDLRDYRFFKEDLIHPTEQAVDYVFEKFSQTYFSGETKKSIGIKSQIMKMEQHVFLHSGTEERARHEKKISELTAAFNKSRES